MDKQEKKRSRRTWGRKETLSFLEAYGRRKEEFDHPRKKKFAYGHVLDDLISTNTLEDETTAEMLESRMKTLLRAYKASKDNEKRTGSAPCPAPFMEQMEEIFGDKPLFSNSHCMNMSGDAVAPLHDSFANKSAEAEKAAEESHSDVESPGRRTPVRTIIAPSSSRQPRKKTTPRQLYFAKKIEFLERKEQLKAAEKEKLLNKLDESMNRRFKEAEEAKERRHKENILQSRSAASQSYNTLYEY